MVAEPVSPNYKIPTTTAGVMAQDRALKQLIGIVDAKLFALEQASTCTIDPHAYGAKGDAISYRNGVVSNGTTFSIPGFTFTADRIGQNAWIEGNLRTIVDVVDGNAILSSAVSNGSSKQYLIGTDDTQAFEAAMQVASSINLLVGTGASSESSWSGGMPAGAVVRLRSGRAYIVCNTQARYDAGKLGAITVPRRCGLIGEAAGQTHIHLAPGNIGHGICNAGAAVSGGGWDDFMQLGNFSLFCNGGFQTSACLDGVHFKAAFNNYFKVDNFMLMANIRVFDSYRDGFYISGRGEGVYFNIFSEWAARYGIFIDGYMDSRFFVCNSGGSKKTGIRINRSAAIHMTNCKSFYSGASGGSTPEDCANFALLADSWLNGQVVLTGCESQECRGSGFYIKSGINQLIGCLSSDPSRAALTASGALPAVRAGFHIAAAASGTGNSNYTVFSGCYHRPSLTLNYSNPDASMYSGTHAVYIDSNVKGCKGTIFTFAQAQYDVAKLGGPGITNRLNGELSIDGNFLPSDWPSAPTITSVVYQPDSSARVTFTAPSSDGGRAVRDYTVQYRLSSDTVWTTFSDPMSDALYIDVTGLTTSSAYVFRVAAANANGIGAYSSDFSYTHNPTAPFAITDLRVTAGAGKAYLVWTAPINGGSAITDYVVEYKPSGGSWTTFADGTSTTAAATVTSLTNDTSYDFRVSAVNAIGTGSSSNVVSATPLAALTSINDANLMAYYDPAVTASVVSGDSTYLDTLKDLSGHGFDLSQPTAGVKPTINQLIGSQKALGFDGLGMYLPVPAGIYGDLPIGDFTMFFTVQLDSGGETVTNALVDAASNSFMLYVRGDMNDVVAKAGGADTAISNASELSAHVIAVRRTGSTLKLYLDGVKAATDGAASDVSMSSMNIGRVNAGYGQLKGRLGPIAFYGAYLSTSVMNTVGAALAAKIGSTWTNAAS